LAEYAVDGKKIPDVDFDIGESYAGLMPIGANMSGDRQLWFWFFPSSNPLAKDEITIWLNVSNGKKSLSLKKILIWYREAQDALPSRVSYRRMVRFYGSMVHSSLYRTLILGSTSPI